MNTAAGSLIAVSVGGLMLVGCMHIDTAELAAQDGQVITSATVEQITADPYGWGGKWVEIEGVLVLNNIESRVYASKAAAKEGWTYDQKAVGIQMSEVARYIPSSLNGERVMVTGKVDSSCNAAHAAADQALQEGRLAWASGFCHTSIGPHLDQASVRAVRSLR